MNEVYEYRCPGRRSIVWLIAAIQAVLLWLAVTHDAPWFIWAIWGPTSLAVAYLLLANPISGLRVDDRYLVLSPWRKPREIPLSEIARVEIRDWSDSTDVVIHLRDGGAVSTFSGDIPPSRCFESILTARGVTVDRS
jgi:hypothetical protein